MNIAEQSLANQSLAVNLTEKQKSNFWKKVNKTDGCWIWQGSLFSSGYGEFVVKNKHLKAHRISWILNFGQIQQLESYHGLCVCHHCDNPPCVNPAHLFIGTNMDNAIDRDRKGRNISLKGDFHYSKLQPEKVLRGESIGTAKHTVETIVKIRELYATRLYSARKLGLIFGVGHPNILAIVRRKIWKHV